MDRSDKKEPGSSRKHGKKVNKGPPFPIVVDEVKDDENTWECSVCTFCNSPEAFKCLMCDVRKGTSTRKPRINPELVAQQVARQQQQIQQRLLKASAKLAEKEAKKEPDPSKQSIKKKIETEVETSPGPSVKLKKGRKSSDDGPKGSRPKLRNVDRNNSSSEAITVNNVTVIITEFQPNNKTKHKNQ